MSNTLKDDETPVLQTPLKLSSFQEALKYRTLTLSELMFECTSTVRVWIVPLIALPSPLYLLSGTIPALQQNQPCQVPLWMAIILVKSQRCRIEWPDYLQPDALQLAVDEEKNSPMFYQLPPFFEITAQVLLSVCQNVPDLPRVRELLQTLKEVRQSKAEKGYSAFQSDVSMYSLNGTTRAEIQQMRPALYATMQTMQAMILDKKKAQESVQSSQNHAFSSQNIPTSDASFKFGNSLESL